MCGEDSADGCVRGGFDAPSRAGVAENVILGNLCPLGTGAFELFLDSEVRGLAVAAGAFVLRAVARGRKVLTTEGRGRVCRLVATPSMSTRTGAKSP